METTQIIDQSALKFNQLSIVTLTALGFILNQPVLPVIVASVLIAGTITPKGALFKLIYRNAVKPLKLMRPDPIEDSPAPHEFAQLLGGLMLGVGGGFLFFGSALVGWILAWVVILLALANLLFGFCAGCFVYYQVGKYGVPGFTEKKKQLSAQR